MAVEKKDLDWSNLSFKYQPCDYSYVCNYHDGAWEEGGLTSEHTITLSEDAGIYQYCQEIFEGMKAYTTEDGSIVVFRPDLNAKRMADSARRMVMPPFPEDKFVDAVKQVVTANEAWVPPFGSGATLYIRPFMIATGEVLGLGASDKYQFRIFFSPVGPYFKAGAKAVKLTIPAYDRAAPMGTGNIKAGLNYGMSLYPTLQAHENGYSENLYLDSRSRTYVEETGGTNVLFVDKNGGLVVPVSATDSILPSITRRSLVELAQHLGIPVEERPVRFDEVLAGDFAECGCIGTAAVISHVGKVEAEGVDVTFPDCGEEGGPVLRRLRDALVGIQTCAAEDPFGWVVKIV